MAVGDVVNAISATNTVLTFQPAAGVEVMISSVGLDNTGTNVRNLFNGTNVSVLASTITSHSVTNGNLKIFINNTNYFTLPALGASAHGSFSGIQIK